MAHAAAYTLPRAALRRPLAVVLGLLLFVGSTSAQSATDDATGKAFINVIGSLSVVAEFQLDFGTIVVGSANSVTLDPNTGAVTAGDGNVTVGKFQIFAADKSTITIDYTATDPDTNIGFTPSVVGDKGNNNQATAAALNSGDNVQTNNNGRYRVWVGGTLDLTGATAGSYSGSFTLTITYVL